MKINQGIKKINPTDKEKNPIISAIQDTRKIIITKNKKTTDYTTKTYYSYQLNIPRDFLMLIQDNYQLDVNINFITFLLEVTKKHYIIKIAPFGIQNILTIPTVFGYLGSNDFSVKMMKKTDISNEQVNSLIKIIDAESVRDKNKIIKKIINEFEINKTDADKLYDTFIDIESKGKKNYQLTLPKKNMEYLQAYDKYQETIETLNNEHKKYNEFTKRYNENNKGSDKELLPIFDIKPLYANMTLVQKFNINGLYFDYELHIHINADIDDAFVDFVKNDIKNPGGIPGWLETLIIDWNDPAVQIALGIDNNIKDYDLTDYGLTSYEITEKEK